jgi:hypothetical protein
MKAGDAVAMPSKSLTPQRLREVLESAAMLKLKTASRFSFKATSLSAAA